MKKSLNLFMAIIYMLLASCSIQSTSSSLAITIDPRIELLAVVQSLSDYGEKYSLLTKLDFEYKKVLLQKY